MRRYIPVLFIILVFLVPACGGGGGGTNIVGGNTQGTPLAWAQAGRVPQSDGLFDVDRNGNLSVAVGTAGAVIVDTGDGQGWRAPVRITRETLTSAVVVDANTIVAGGTQSIIRSDDRGETWKTVLDAVFVRDLASHDKSVLAALSNGIVHSQDGGQTWTPANGINPNAPQGAVAFVDADIAINATRDGIVSRTIDAGRNWNKITSLPTTGNILDVAFATSKDGAIIGTGGKLFWTNDAGLNWGQAVHSLLNDSAFKLSFVNATRGYMLAQGREIHETQFAGQSWAQVATIPRFNAFTPSDIKALTTTHWIVVGNDGVTLETTDGGVTWSDNTEGERGTWFDIAFATPTLGVAAFRSATTQSTVYRTANGGATWAELPFTQAPIGVAQVVAFGSETHGIVAGTIGEAIATSDGGATWVDADPGSGDINGIVALDENTYVVVGQQETLHRTTDLGANWVRVPFDLNNPTTYLDVARFPGSDDLLAIGFDRGIFSDDGGQTWTPVSTDVVGSRAVACPGGDVALMAGARILRSTNRGVDWTEVADPDEDINVITFGDGEHGIAVGNAGTIFETFDGGLTWREAEPTTGSYLFAGTFRDPNTALIGGENGALLVGTTP